MKNLREGTGLRIALIAAALSLLAGCAPPSRPFAATPKPDPQRGEQVFQAGCAVCHYPDREQVKVGPGLKGIFRAAKLPNGQHVSDEIVRAWIRNGGGKMPPFGKALNEQQINDLVGYLKTL